MGCCWASQLKGKGYWRKGAANELELSTYALSKVVASRAIDPGWDPLSPISRMCQSWVCCCLQLLKACASRLVFLWCDGSELSRQLAYCMDLRV